MRKLILFLAVGAFMFTTMGVSHAIVPMGYTVEGGTAVANGGSSGSGGSIGSGVLGSGSTVEREAAAKAEFLKEWPECSEKQATEQGPVQKLLGIPPLYKNNKYEVTLVETLPNGAIIRPVATFAFMTRAQDKGIIHPWKCWVPAPWGKALEVTWSYK